MYGISSFTPEELAELAAFDAQIDALDFVEPEDTDAYLPTRRGRKLNPAAQQRKKQMEKAYRKSHRAYYNQKHKEWYRRNHAKALSTEAERKRTKKAASDATNIRNGQRNLSPTV